MWQTDYLLLTASWYEDLLRDKESEQNSPKYLLFLSGTKWDLMEWSTVVSKGLFVPQHDFDIPPNIARDFTYLTQRARGETGCCKYVCALY